MFDIGATELLVIAIVAILVIGPKDMPLALRTAGRWIGKMRRVSAHFRSGLDAMIREAELEDMEKKWQEQNAQIMREHPAAEEMTEIDQAAPETQDLPQELPQELPQDLLPDPMADDPPPQPPQPPAGESKAG